MVYLSPRRPFQSSELPGSGTIFSRIEITKACRRRPGGRPAGRPSARPDGRPGRRPESRASRPGPDVPDGRQHGQVAGRATANKPQKAPKRATSVNVQLPCLQKDLRAGSISRDIVNVPSELCRRRSGMFTEVARLVPPENKPTQARRGDRAGHPHPSVRAFIEAHSVSLCDDVLCHQTNLIE